MVDEAERSKDVVMNPLLRTILESEEVRLSKRDIAKQIGGDIYKNSIRRVYQGKSNDNVKAQRPYISLDDDRRLLSPSERLLRMVAAIVHKANAMERTARKIKQQKKKMFRKRKNNVKPLGIVTVEEQPKQRFVDKIFGLNRIKRSVIKLSTDLSDMRAFVDQINHSDNDYTETEDEEQNQDEEEIDDYLNDDYYYDDDDENNRIDSQSSLQLQPRYTTNFDDDYESGSVREFIELARQRDRRHKNLVHMNEESDEVDDYDDLQFVDDYSESE